MDWLEHIRPYIKQVTAWEKQVSYWPRRCWLSNKIIWLRPALRGTRRIRRDWDISYEYLWVDADELMLYNLKYT